MHAITLTLTLRYETKVKIKLVFARVMNQVNLAFLWI